MFIACRLLFEQGKVLAMGSFNDLVNKGVDIMSMLGSEEKEKGSPRKRNETIRSASLSMEDLTGSKNNVLHNISPSISSIYESVTSLASNFEEEKVKEVKSII